MRLFSFIYIATPKIFRIILICPICLTANCAACSCFLGTVRIWKTFDKIDANVREFCRGIIRKFSFKQQKMTKFGENATWMILQLNNVHKLRKSSQKIEMHVHFERPCIKLKRCNFKIENTKIKIAKSEKN